MNLVMRCQQVTNPVKKVVQISLIFVLSIALRSMVFAADWAWNVSETPPEMLDPVLLDVSKVQPEHSAGWKRFFGIARSAHKLNCDGWIYKIGIDANDDAVIYTSAQDTLKYPLQITGGKNVRVIGLHFELETQAGCGVGELPNLPINKYPNANIHPRVPGAIALRLEQSHTTFVEGLHIDVRGHEADCIVIRNLDSMSNRQAQKQRDVIIQNTFCSGVEGLGKSKIGDGVHGDLFQNQGQDVMRRLVFENVSMRTSQEGIVIHASRLEALPGTQELVIRRYDYTWDRRYVGDDDIEQFGLAVAGSPGPNWIIEDIRIDDYREGGDYINIGGQRYGNSPARNVKPHPEIRSGLPPGGAFAPPDRTGLNYISPHGGYAQ
jgi:hypothetical protein